ncbi:MAG TPA: glycosyltransferase, partial [Gaiellaceae bacterium]|nr:glycosyltransferase [Gaiellaceae bacterium]
SRGVAALVARRADAIVAAADAIAGEAQNLKPRGRVVTIENGCDFDDFAGMEHARTDTFRLTHTGSFFGRRDPRPFLRALAESGLEDVRVRFVGDFRPGDREFMESLGLGDRVEVIDYVPRRRSLELQRESDALLLLIPEAGGRGRGVLSGKVFEYIAAERPILAVVPPDGAAAKLIEDTGVGVVAAPEDVDGIRDALVSLHARWLTGGLDAAPLSPAWRDKLSRGRRVEQLADLLRSLA